MSPFAGWCRIAVIPHSWQDYDTIGNWLEADGITCIFVSDMGNEKFEAAVAIHELVEALLCRWAGISEEAVTAFDEAHLDFDEPGRLREAPYHKQHMAADAIERMFCQLAGISWPEYEAAIGRLF